MIPTFRVATAAMAPVRTCALLSVLVFSGVAVGQTPLPLTNPSFETRNPFSIDDEPLGWHNLSSPADVTRRTVGDGGPIFPTPRTGQSVIAIGTPGNSDFRGFTTDTLNFFLPGLPYYDPVFDWNGGDIVVTGWYNIPVADAIEGDSASIKLNVKLFFQDYATLDPWGEAGPMTIQGHTNGQWEFFEARWPIASIREEVIFNDTFGCGGTGDPCTGCFSSCLPPYPERCKIVIGRFGFGGAPSRGTIYWDDVTYAQVPPTPDCPADFNDDGFLDFFDFDDFVVCFEGGACPPGKSGDYNGDGFADFFDYDDFVVDFETGCP